MNNRQQQRATAKNHHANITGPQIRKLRYARGLSQAKFAVQLQLKGLDICRDVVAQIEGQTHCVKDKELRFFARVLEVTVDDLFPSSETEQFSSKVENIHCARKFAAA